MNTPALTGYFSISEIIQIGQPQKRLSESHPFHLGAGGNCVRQPFFYPFLDFF